MTNVVHKKSYPMAELFGFEAKSAENGVAVITVMPQEKFCNPMQRMHGGFAATMIDTAMGWAVGTKVADGLSFGTIDLKVTYVRKIDTSSGQLTCTGTVLHAGRTVLAAEAKLVDASGKLCATGTGTFMVYPS